jgi:prepilin peptidase CpaA
MGHETDILFATIALILASIGAVYDVLQRRIPNLLSYGGIVAGLGLRTAILGWQGVTTALVGGLLAGGLFLLVYITSGMGAGDVKLMAAVGCISGPALALEIAMACGLAGGVMAIAFMIWRRSTLSTLHNVGQLIRFRLAHAVREHPTINLNNPSAIRLPYGVAIAAGASYPVLAYLFAR